MVFGVWIEGADEVRIEWADETADCLCEIVVDCVDTVMKKNFGDIYRQPK